MPEVDVQDDIYQILEARSEEKDFDSAEEYIQHLLEQVVKKIQREKQESEGYSDEDEEKVKERLRGLGYLD